MTEYKDYFDQQHLRHHGDRFTSEQTRAQVDLIFATLGLGGR